MARFVCALLAAALLVHCAVGARISFLGVSSDPCADVAAPWNTGTAEGLVQTSCSLRALPNAAVTVYVASEGSISASGASRKDPDVSAAGRSVVINVDNANSVAGEVAEGRQICLSTKNSFCGNVQASTCSNIRRTVVAGVQELTFSMNSEWDDISLELEDEPRPICIRNADNGAVVIPPVYVGIKLGVVFNCGADADCAAHPALTGGTSAYLGLVSNLETRVLATRATCCMNNAAGTGAGICINTNVQTCCGGVALETGTERCCNEAQRTIRGINANCPCSGAVNGAADAIGCPVGETCCLPTKFAEFNSVQSVGGLCYNPSTVRCCNTGELYDPGTAQCCVISGVLSANEPCPCSLDSHCLGASVDPNQSSTSMRCCRQRFPEVQEREECTPYANFPSSTDIFGQNVPVNFNTRDSQSFLLGDNIVQVQRCPGVCVDTRFQMCCNGVACVQDYEKCCNSTCCNKFVGKCAESYRGSSSSRTNPVNFNTPFEICTIVENLGPLKTYWVFVLPTFLLATTLLSLALVIIYATSATTRAFSFVERAIVLIGVLLVLFAIPTFFSPTYKYGMVTVIVGLIAILAASARLWWLNVLAVGASIVLLLFLIDPFHGNWFWNFANGRLFNGNPDFEQMGVLHTLDKMWTGTANFHRQDFCIQFYDYFALDPLIQDYDRKDQVTFGTFGFCVREWVAALLILELFVILLALLIFVLLVLALVLRFRKVAPLPVAVAMEPEYVDLY